MGRMVAGMVAGMVAAGTAAGIVVVVGMVVVAAVVRGNSALFAHAAGQRKQRPPRSRAAAAVGLPRDHRPRRTWSFPESPRRS